MKSMTGYARKVAQTSKGSFQIEIHSVNRKNLETSTNLPRDLLSLDIELRKWISKRAMRGKITLRITTQAQVGAQLPDHDSLQMLKLGWEKIAHDLGVTSPITIEFLADQCAKQHQAEVYPDQFFSEIESDLEEAYLEWDAMRSDEGKALAVDIHSRIDNIRNILDRVETLAKDSPKTLKEKILERVSEVIDDERLVQEVALVADRIDIVEEIVRLRSHLEQFTEKKGGKALDFLLQEMFREVNTMGSKSPEIEVKRCILEMKEELERIREQVQNIE